MQTHYRETDTVRGTQLIGNNYAIKDNLSIGNGISGRDFRGRLVFVWDLLLCVVILAGMALSQTAVQSVAVRSISSSASPSPATTPTAEDAGVVFVEGSVSQVVMVRDGKRYLVDLAARTIREDAAAPNDSSASSSSSSNSSNAQVSTNQTPSAAGPVGERKNTRIYRPGDDLLFNVPTGRSIDRHGLYLDFTHRFPYEAAFTGPGRGNTLLGLDDFAIPSFGLRYGITAKLSVMAYRSPSIIGRPIEFMVGYSLLSENDGKPLNAVARFSIDGQNNFSKNYSENFELIVSRSLGHRAQLYAVPTYSIHARPVLSNSNNSLADALPDQPCSAPFAAGIPTSFGVRPCANTFSIGTGVSVDIRPTVALIAEATPTLVNGEDLGIHRPEFAFAIQKKIWRHAFTLGFSNGPGSVVSQREGTRATLVQNPSADKLANMFIGFNLTRQIF